MDFRGWLSQKAAAGDVNARYALDFMGNDAGIDANWVGQIENPARHGGAASKNTGFGWKGKNYNTSAVDLGNAMRGFANEWQQQGFGGQVQGASAGSYGGGSGSSDTLTAADRSLIDNEWAQNNRYYTGLLGSLDPRQRAAQAEVDRAAGAETKSLATQRDIAEENLEREETKLEGQYGRGLRSLGENIRNTLQGQYNVLGMGGAGDSSAADMLGIAVADLGNDAQGEMKADFDDQLTDIGTNRKQVKMKFEDELNKINAWKQSKYAEVKDKFDQERNEINNKLNLNDTQRLKALASAKSAAMSMIGAVDQTINNRLAQIVASYNDTSAPKASLEGLPEYKSTRIAPAVVDAGNGPALTPEQAAQAIAPPRRREEY